MIDFGCSFSSLDDESDLCLGKATGGRETGWCFESSTSLSDDNELTFLSLVMCSSLLLAELDRCLG